MRKNISNQKMGMDRNSWKQVNGHPLLTSIKEDGRPMNESMMLNHAIEKTVKMCISDKVLEIMHII